MNTSTTYAAVRLGRLGDVALATGVLEYWRKARGASFVFITRRGLAPVLEGHPAVQSVVGLDESALQGLAWWKTAGELARRFKGAPLVDLHGSLRTRVLALAWKGKVRRYPKLALLRRVYAKKGYAWAEARLERLNVPQRYALALEKKAPDREDILPLAVIADHEKREAETILAPITSGRPLALFHPYATHPNKAWPASHWQRLAAGLDYVGWDWAVIGRSEATLAGIDAGRDLTNATTLRRTMAMLSRADVLVTGDSGPMHLASAVGTPVLAFFGPTTRAWGFYPAGKNDVVLETPLDCRPCSLHGGAACPRDRECLGLITPEKVVRTLVRMKKESL